MKRGRGEIVKFFKWVLTSGLIDIPADHNYQ